MRNKKITQILSVVLSIMLLMSNIAYADTANTEPAKYSDIAGNKYESQIREWIANGFIKGYPDGTFKPGNQITRAEFMTLVNRAFGFSDAMDINYSDIKKSDWYYKEAAKATKAGFIKGDNGRLLPLNNISRQEIAMIIARLTKNEAAVADDVIINNLTDANLIPAWSKTVISTGLKKGFFEGFIEKTFKPTENITRLEAVVALDRAFKSMYKAAYTLQGTYGPTTGMQTLDGDVVVVAPEVTIHNTIINGNLILRETIGEGNVSLDNVVVKGETIVKGGGEHSIVIKNSTLSKVIVIKEGNTVRVVATGSTKIDTVNVGANAKLEEYELTGAGFNDVLVLDDIPAGANVTFVGNFDDVSIDSPNINISVTSGAIGSLKLTETATDTKINLGQHVTVTTLTLDAAANVTGAGTINTANINVSGTIIEQKPAAVNIPTGVQATVSGGPATPTPPAAGGGVGGGAHQANSAPGASNVTITGEAVAGKTLTGNYTYTDAENDIENGSTFNWYRASSPNGSKRNISGANSRTYTAQAEDVGMYLFFEVTPVAATGTKRGNAVISAASTQIIAVYEVVTGDTAREYVETQDFGYWADATPENSAFNVGFKLNLAKLSYKDIEKIEVALLDAAGNELARRTATDQQILQLKSDDDTYGGLDGQLSAAFIKRTAAASNEWWSSTPYNFTTPAKAVVRITSNYKVYTVETGAPTGIPAVQEITGEAAKAYVNTQDFGYWADATPENSAFNVGFKLNLDNINYENIEKIEVALLDAAGNELARRTATDQQILQLKSDDDTYGGLDGQLSAAFIKRTTAASNEWWSSTPYNFTTPAKAVVRITSNYKVYTVETGAPTGIPTVQEITGEAAKAYVDTQDFGYWPDSSAYNIGFKLNLEKIDYEDIEKIEVSLVDAAGNELASRTATGDQILKLKSEDETYGGLEGQLSAAFIKRTEAAANEWWNSTLYDFSIPAKAVVKITTNYKVYRVESGAPNGIGIADAEQLVKAIKNQSDNQTWYIEAGDYALAPISGFEAKGQEGWYFPITANNITVKGIGNPILYGNVYTKNGNWATQNLVTIFGSNVTLEGLTLMSKVEGNKAIEVAGANATIQNCTIEPNVKVANTIFDNFTNVEDKEFNKQWGGSLYFNAAGNHVVKNVTIKNAGISFRYSPANTHITFDNVNIINNTNIDDINSYRFSTGFNNAGCSIEGKPIVTYIVDDQKNNMASAVKAAKAGEIVNVEAGTYTVTNTINVDQPITIKGAADLAAKITTSGGSPVFTINAAATVDGIFIEKTDKTNQHLITITADDVKIKNGKFIGQYTQGDNEVARAIVPNAGIKGYVLTGNYFESLRQPAYLEGPGTVTSNFVKNTRGWVVCVNHVVNFSDNSFEGNAVDIAIIANNQASSENYSDVVTISSENNGAYVENQLSGVSAKDGHLYKTIWIDNEGTNAYFKTIQAAVAAAEDGDVINIADGTYELPSQLLIAKPITIIGSGSVTIKPAAVFNEGTYNADKHLVSINGVGGLVKLENLTISNSKRTGINIWESANVVLQDITSKNNAAAGLVVNNSAVVADNLNTSGNGWGYGVNVDNGSNPSAGAPATSFTLNSGTISEPKQIVSDKGGVTIIAPNYQVLINDASIVFGATITNWYTYEEEGNSYDLLDTSVNFNFDKIDITEIDSIKFSLYQGNVLLGTAISTDDNLVKLLKECAQYWGQTADTYTDVTGIRTMSSAFMNRTEENDNGYWVRSVCTATNASVPNGLVIEVVVGNVTYTATH